MLQCSYTQSINSIYEPTPEGYLFRTLQRGDGFGERSVIFGGLRTLTAIATTDC